MNDEALSKKPTPDAAELDAFFPSPFSLSQWTSPRSNLEGADYPTRYKGNRKVLVICADERYLPTDNGTLFSTGNHPVETLLPMYHLHKAGFDFDIATLSGEMAKFEFWAMPRQDEAITGLHRQYLDRFRKPHKLSDIVAKLDPDTNYAAVFIPGGHGALIGLPESRELAALIHWVMDNDRYLISLCHGPAGFLALAVDGKSNPLKGYKICAFPDAADRQTPQMGYMPGGLTWFFGEKLEAMGIKVVNADVTGAVHQDRKVLTGDSPLAANALGKLSAVTLLKELAGA